MKGRNEIRFCEAAMIEAMQDWCDEHMTDKVMVTSISLANDNGKTFIVWLADADEATS